MKIQEVEVLFKFGNQKVVEIAGIKIGGEPGENPTALIGSIFYHRHRIVEDEKKGIFDREAAENLIKDMEEMSDRTGNPGLVDVVVMSEEALTRYIDFVAGVTDNPFLIDSALPEIKIAAVKFIEEAGLGKRVIYNSISPESKNEEFEALRNSEIESAIALTYTPKITSTTARVESFEGLLPRIKNAGVTEILVDTFVMDVPSLPVAARAGMRIKKEFGYPVGSGAHNAIASWRGFENLFGKGAEKYAVLIADVLQIVAGSDFVLYGPIEDAKKIFPAVYVVDTAYRYFLRTGDVIEI